jgi:hypothetical protein
MYALDFLYSSGLSGSVIEFVLIIGFFIPFVKNK